MKKAFLLTLLVGILLLTACASHNSVTDEDVSSALGTRTTYSFSDMMYGSHKVFTFYKSEDYDIIEGNGTVLEINGNTHDLRSYFKLYKVSVEEVIYSSDGEPFDEILIREFYRDMASGANVEQDDMATLKDGSLYLGFAYEHSDGQYTPFEYFEIGRKGKLKNTELTNPWKNIADVKFTYEKELAGGGAIPMPELTKIKMNFVSQYGEELFYPTDFNYKILANEFVTSEEYANISTFSLDKMEKADNNTDQPYFEIIAYPNNSKDTVSIRYDAETGDAIAWSKEVND